MRGSWRSGGRWWLTAALAVTAVLAAYVAWASYLALMASEGAVPPRWRSPEVPGDAHVVSEEKECGSGGCWRELVLRPPTGQSPEDLAAEMGVTDTQRLSWSLRDPHRVEVGSRVADGNLTVYVRY